MTERAAGPTAGSTAEPTAGSALRLALKNDSFELGRLRESFDEFADRHRIPDQARFDLQLCLEELVLNVINYGFDDDEEHEVQVDFEIRDDSRTMTVSIRDDGRKFDPLTEVPEPDVEGNLEDRAVGGLGVHFVRQFMDGASYRHAGGKNCLTLTKNLGP